MNFEFDYHSQEQPIRYSPAFQPNQMVSQSSLSNYSTNDQYTCPICFNNYNTTNFCPMIVCNNQHSICQTCCGNLSQGTCPFCRQNIGYTYVDNETLRQLNSRPLNRVQYRVQLSAQQKQQILQIADREDYQRVIYLVHTHHKNPLEQVTELRENGRKINKIISLSFFANLSVLDLSSNVISSTLNLGDLKKLKELNLQRNRITTMENMNCLPKLEILTLNENLITFIPRLTNLKRLKQLYLNNNKIQRIQNLHDMPVLDMIQLCQNKISKVEGVFQHPSLTTINLGSNPINYQRNEGAIQAAQQLIQSFWV